MRVFRCDLCSEVVSFSSTRCPACDASLGYVDAERTVRVLHPTDDPAVHAVDGTPHWRCMNAAWGCNWMVPVGTDTVWCRSCRLTRGRPDESRPDAVEAWVTAEAAKRRLVHQLDELGLPIDPRSPEHPDGLTFDLVHLPGEGGITGHLDGVVTLDLVETDDRHRDDLRRLLGEPFRTVIGHLRHEIAHHYWGRLVGQSDDLVAFRRLFGDERVDYAAAVEHHYATGGPPWDPNRFVTGYAASHPHEDWAETFAHYLHILDALDTAAAHHLVPSNRVAGLVSEHVASIEMSEILEIWQPINVAVNEIAASIGSPPVYPFEPRGLVVDKLAFVHRQVVAHSERERFYGSH